MTLIKIYEYLNKNGLCDQIHYWKDREEFVFYHWNKQMSDLIPTVVVKGKQISELKYPRFLMPLVFMFVNSDIENDIDLEEHRFVRVKRG